MLSSAQYIRLEEAIKSVAAAQQALQLEMARGFAAVRDVLTAREEAILTLQRANAQEEDEDLDFCSLTSNGVEGRCATGLVTADAWESVDSDEESSLEDEEVGLAEESEGEAEFELEQIEEGMTTLDVHRVGPYALRRRREGPINPLVLWETPTEFAEVAECLYNAHVGQYLCATADDM